MTAHLTQEELTEQLLGASSFTVNAHLLSCPQCANELDRLKNSISSFRDAAHVWSENDLSQTRSREARATHFTMWPRAGWVLAAAALILFVAGSAVYLHQDRIAEQAQATKIAPPAATLGVSQSQLDQDNQLLSQISTELGESIPAPMQPLLVTESSTSSQAVSK